MRTVEPASAVSEFVGVLYGTSTACGSYPKALCELLRAQHVPAPSDVAPWHVTWDGALITSFCLLPPGPRAICSDNLYLVAGRTTWSVDALGPRAQLLALLETFQPVR